jgi:hypothetical protein
MFTLFLFLLTVLPLLLVFLLPILLLFLLMLFLVLEAPGLVALLFVLAGLVTLVPEFAGRLIAPRLELGLVCAAGLVCVAPLPRLMAFPPPAL